MKLFGKIALILTIILCFTFVLMACTDDTDKENDGSKDQPKVTTVATTTSDGEEDSTTTADNGGNGGNGGEGGEEAATTTEAKKLTDGGANTEGGFGELHPVS